MLVAYLWRLSIRIGGQKIREVNVDVIKRGFFFTSYGVPLHSTNSIFASSIDGG